MNVLSYDAIGPDAPAAAVALGFFDGVHRGHRQLLARTVAAARERGLCPTVFTFAEEADGLKAGAKRICSFEDKLRLFEEAGIERVLLAPFSSLRETEGEPFVREVLCGRCRTRLAICGFNYRFGHRAACDAADLTRFMAAAGGEAEVLAPLLWQGVPVSSTAIREAVRQGRMEDACAMLGRPFSFVAPVVHGKELGRTLGIPTVNQALPAGMACPPYGVYRSLCSSAVGEFAAVTNVGVRPTVEEHGAPNCESYLIGFTDDLYGQPVRVSLLQFLRPERRFADIGELRAQMQQDIAEVWPHEQ